MSASKPSQPSTLTRRDILRLGAGALLAWGLWPGRTRANSPPLPSGDFTFIAVNDLHFRDQACIPWFENVVKQMKASAPIAEFCLLGGDLADEGLERQLIPVRDIFSKLGMPVHSVVGNHDYLEDNTRDAFEALYPGQINYSFEHRGWQIVCLDTTEGTKSVNTVIPDATFTWLDRHLPLLDNQKPTIILTHFPMGDFVYGRPVNADDLLNRFVDFNLQAVFCGHFHGYTLRTRRQAVLTTDRCCSRIRPNHDGTKEKGWFVCQAANGQVTRRFVTFVA